MTTASTDPRAIEAGLERDRADLASTLDALSDRVSVDNLAKEALGAITSRASAYTSTIDTAVRGNPVAVAVIGAGVAWLLLGNRITGSKSVDTSSSMGHPVHDELPRWESEGGPPPEYGSLGYRPTTSQGDDHAWHEEAHGLRARAAAALRRIEAEAKSAYESVRDGIAGGASSARDFAAERASVVSSFTSDLRTRLSHGLDALPEGSREQVVAARERAYAASIKAERMGRMAVTEPTRMMEEHPLVAGAVAFALGAAVAAALPRTDTENRAFGSERDRLMGDASRLFQAERSRAMEIAGNLGQEVKAAAMETFEAVSDKAGEAAQDAVNRVRDRASEEIGNVRSDIGRSDPVIG